MLMMLSISADGHIVLRSDNFTVKRTGALTIKKQPLSAERLILFLPCLRNQPQCRTRTIRTSIASAATICNTEDGIHPESDSAAHLHLLSLKTLRSALTLISSPAPYATLKTASTLTPRLLIFIFSHSRHCAARAL